jgi:hypothetical protein
MGYQDRYEDSRSTREILESLKDSLLLEEDGRRKFWEERFRKS